MPTSAPVFQATGRRFSFVAAGGCVPPRLPMSNCRVGSLMTVSVSADTPVSPHPTSVFGHDRVSAGARGSSEGMADDVGTED
ncbi:hypothetical protein GCM10023175_50750 [Pseudonocardia xishanensis]|uniref:Uncharacterized protein n=1 Tax=Pseudonocardia xishanensis TaxID=630995 RepID=A0ABP8S074_9PSEU